MSPPPPSDQTPDPSVISELCEVLSDEYRRHVLYYLIDQGGTVTVDELRAHLSERTESDPDEIVTRLEHVALPKLDAHGAIEYDRGSGQVRYEGEPLTTELLERIEARERTDD